MSRKHVLLPLSYSKLIATVAILTLIPSIAAAEDPPRIASAPASKQAEEATRTSNAILVASAGADLSKKIGAGIPQPNQSLSSPGDASSSTLAEHQGNNVTAHVTSRLLKQLLAERDVSNYRKIQEYVMGSYSTGSAFTTGKIALELMPSPAQAMLGIHFTGTTNVGDNVAYRGSVAIYSKCNTSIDAFKPIFIDAEGIHAGASRAQCSSNIQVDDIDAKRRMIERIAWRRVDRMQGQLEQAVSERAQVQLTQQLDQEANSMLTEANQQFGEKFRDPMLQRGAYPARVQGRTTATHLHLSALQASGTQRGAETLPDANPYYDFVVSVHETFPENMLEVMRGGTKVTDREFVKLIKLVTGEVPRPMWIHDRTPRWDVTLAKQRPITIKFEDGRIAATLAFEQASRGDEQLSQPFQVTVVYRPEIAADGPRIIRERQPHFEFGDQKSLADRPTDMQAFFMKKFTAFFAEEIYFDGFVPPAGGSWGKLKQIEPKEWRPHNGWLVFSYHLKESEAKVATTRK